MRALKYAVAISALPIFILSVADAVAQITSADGKTTTFQGRDAENQMSRGTVDRATSVHRAR